MLQCAALFRIYILWRIFFICLFICKSYSQKSLYSSTLVFCFIRRKYNFSNFWRHHRVRIWTFGFNTQGGQNVRIVRIFYFVTLKFYGLYGFFFKLYGLYGFLSWKYAGFFNFHSFQQIFHENFKKKFSSKWS